VALWHLKKLVPHWENELPTLSWWIVKVFINAKFYNGSLLGEIELYKWFEEALIATWVAISEYSAYVATIFLWSLQIVSEQSSNIIWC
jgi:hypothetical protein